MVFRRGGDGQIMNFGVRSDRRKREKDLKNEIRQLRKQMLRNGGEKSNVTHLLGEFEAVLLEAGRLSADYQTACSRIKQAGESIARLLDCMSESPVREVRESLQSLSAILDEVYHECTIRADDADFRSSVACFREMLALPDSGAVSRNDIMLRSELENMKAVLDDAAGFLPPDFFALAYYTLYGEKEALREMENRQRNDFLLAYLNEHFSAKFFEEARKRGVEQQVCELMNSYVEMQKRERKETGWI